MKIIPHDQTPKLCISLMEVLKRNAIGKENYEGAAKLQKRIDEEIATRAVRSLIDQIG